VTDKNDGALVEKAFLIDPLDMDTLPVEKIFQVFKPPFGQFEHDLYIERITIGVRVPLVDDRNDISANFGYGFQGCDQLAGRVLHLKFHGDLQKTTLLVVIRAK
jgi:hypothetical protein